MNIELARHNMIEQQIRPWDVLDQRVLDIIQTIPREEFVPRQYRHLAFIDTEIPLGHNQCMLPPRVEGGSCRHWISSPMTRYWRLAPAAVT